MINQGTKKVNKFTPQTWTGLLPNLLVNEQQVISSLSRSNTPFRQREKLFAPFSEWFPRTIDIAPRTEGSRNYFLLTRLMLASGDFHEIHPTLEAYERGITRQHAIIMKLINFLTLHNLTSFWTKLWKASKSEKLTKRFLMTSHLFWWLFNSGTIASTIFQHFIRWK